MAEGVKKSYRKIFCKRAGEALETVDSLLSVERKYSSDNEASDYYTAAVKGALEAVEAGTGESLAFQNSATFKDQMNTAIGKRLHLQRNVVGEVLDRVTDRAWKETDQETYQAMEALVHNLCTMQSRAGAQSPFSSLNLGTDTSPEGRMVIRNFLLAIEAGRIRTMTCSA